jgi:aspartate/methionine/tyrosine aminotransferase
VKSLGVDTALRLAKIKPFYVMEFAKAASKMAQTVACDPAQGGRRMIYLNIGEPDFTAPEGVQRASQAAISLGQTQYTDALGLPALRQGLSDWYLQRFGLTIEPQRIVVTAGASAGLLLTCLALINPGDEILMPDPSYPCNRHFVAAADGVARSLVVTAHQRFQLTANQVAQAWTGDTRGVLLASPSNPTGTSMEPQELQRMVQEVRRQEGFLIVDEIYLGLSFDSHFGQSVLSPHISLKTDSIIAVNSFSKYFCMTGWRLGWLVLPPTLVGAVEKLAQNLFICPSAVAQHAALACFEAPSLAEFENRRHEFKRRRDYLIPALNALGLTVPVFPDGAFYAWADCSRFNSDSWSFAEQVMHHCQLAITPGKDFSNHDGARYVRFSFANSMPELQEAIHRLSEVLPNWNNSNIVSKMPLTTLAV